MSERHKSGQISLRSGQNSIGDHNTVDFGPFKVCPLVGIVSDSRALNSSNY
jgi:hypothetical protein